MPRGSHLKGPASATLGIGDPRASSQTHTASRLPTGPIGCHCSNRPGEWAGASESQATFKDPLCQNPWAHAPPVQCPHTGPSLCSPHNDRLRSVGLLGTNPKPRSALDGPFSRGLALQCWDLGTAKPRCQTHPVARPPQGPIGAPWLIQDGKKCRGL